MAEILKIDRFNIDFSGSLKDDDALAPANIPMALKVAMALATGSGADSANKVYFKRRTLAAVTAENLDLSGTLTNRLGTVLAYTKVRAIIISLHADPAAGPLLIGGHATLAFRNWITAAPDMDTAQPRIRLRNGGHGGLFVLTGYDSTAFAVTAATEDQLKIENEHATLTATYDIAVLGE